MNDAEGIQRVQRFVQRFGFARESHVDGQYVVDQNNAEHGKEPKPDFPEILALEFYHSPKNWQNRGRKQQEMTGPEPQKFPLQNRMSDEPRRIEERTDTADASDIDVELLQCAALFADKKGRQNNMERTDVIGGIDNVESRAVAVRPDEKLEKMLQKIDEGKRIQYRDFDVFRQFSAPEIHR